MSLFQKTSEECSHPDEFDRIHESHSTTDDFDLPSPSEPSPPSEVCFNFVTRQNII